MATLVKTKSKNSRKISRFGIILQRYFSTISNNSLYEYYYDTYRYLKLDFMLYYALKVIISAIVIVAITELAKRNTGFAALVASLPLTSLLAFIWLYIEGSTVSQIEDLSKQIFWFVLPSLLFFVLLPIFLKHGLGFWLSLSLSAVATIGCYFSFIFFLPRIGIHL